MAISLASLKRSTALMPPRILLHGVAGVGKTTFAAKARRRRRSSRSRTGSARSRSTTSRWRRRLADVTEALVALYEEPHEFGTVVVDSVDWLEPLIWKHVAAANGWRSIEEPGFGKGYAAALDVWREYLEALNALRNDRGMTVIQIAHTDIKRFDSPEHEPYDRYIIKLHARAAALLQEHSDVVLFANYRISHRQGGCRLQQEGDPRARQGRAGDPHRRAPGLPREEPLRPARHARARLGRSSPRRCRTRPSDHSHPDHRRPDHGQSRRHLRCHDRRSDLDLRAVPAGPLHRADRPERDAPAPERPGPGALASRWRSSTGR